MTEPIADTVQKYDHPKLTADDVNRASEFARKLVASRDTRRLLVALTTLCIENLRLTLECNDHRAARNFERIKSYEVPKV